MATKKTTSKSTTAAKSKAAKSTATGKSKSATAPATAPKVTTARKTVKIAPKTPAPEGAVAAETAKPAETVAASEAPAKPDHLRKRALINAVAERSGVKRREAKAALEATLAILGENIAEGRQMNLPGFGKLKVVRTKKLSGAHVYVARIRQADTSDAPDPEAGGKDPLAEAAE